MSVNVTRYDANDCTIVVDSVYITGLGEDMIKGSKDEDFFSPSVGAQGDVIKNIINNSLGSVTITVQATSPQKPYLMSLAKLQDTFPLWCINKALGERFGGTMANLITFAEVDRGKEAKDMEFVFKVFDYDVTSD